MQLGYGGPLCVATQRWGFFHAPVQTNDLNGPVARRFPLLEISAVMTAAFPGES